MSTDKTATPRPPMTEVNGQDGGGEEPAITDITSDILEVVAPQIADIAFARASSSWIPQPDDAGSISNRVYLKIFGDPKDDVNRLGREIRAEITRTGAVTRQIKTRIEELTRQTIKECRDAECHRVTKPTIPQSDKEVVVWTKQRLPYNTHMGDHTASYGFADEVTSKRDRAIDIRQALMRLPEITRAVIYLKYWEGYSVRRIVEELERRGVSQLSEKSIYRIMKDGKAALAACLRGIGESPD